MRQHIFTTGAGEDWRHPGFLDRFTDGIFEKRGRYNQVARIPYLGTIGPVKPTVQSPWASTSESVDDAANKIAWFLRQTESVPVIWNYSLGAWGFEEFLRRCATGRKDYRNKDGSKFEIQAVINIGNPQCPGGATGFGIMGKSKQDWRGVNLRGRHIELASNEDIIANCPPHSAWRGVPWIANFLTLRMGLSNFRSAERELITAARQNLQLPTIRDVELLKSYLNHIGHEQIYLSEPYRAAARGVLG